MALGTQIGAAWLESRRHKKGRSRRPAGWVLDV